MNEIRGGTGIDRGDSKQQVCYTLRVGTCNTISDDPKTIACPQPATNESVCCFLMSESKAGICCAPDKPIRL